MTSRLKDADDLFTRHSLEGLQKLVHADAIFQVLEKSIHGHPSATEADTPAKTLRVAP